MGRTDGFKRKQGMKRADLTSFFLGRGVFFVFAVAALGLLLGGFLQPARAVLGVPIANMQHAERFEKAGRFARAAEERELAAEFYHWISIPQYREYLAYYEAREDTGKVAECKRWLKYFEVWIALCRKKAEEDWARVKATPAQREKSRRRVEKRMIASADLYPMMHHSMLGFDLNVLERKARYPEQFETIAEARERTARLYEAMGVRYSLHAAELWEKEGKTEDAARMRAEAERYRELIEHNRRLAQKARQRAKEAQRWNDLDYLQRLLDEGDEGQRELALERLAMLKRWAMLRRSLTHSDEAVRHQALAWLIKENDLLGLLWAEATFPNLREEARAALQKQPLTVEAMKIPLLLEALDESDDAIRSFAVETLSQQLGRAFPSGPEAAAAYLAENTAPGLLGVYYRGQRFEQEHTSRVDSQIAFEWETPPLEIPQGAFSIRWIGWIRIPKAGDYELGVENDDGARLWIDEKLLVDDWRNHGRTTHGKRLSLTGGYHLIRLEYYNHANQGVLRLLRNHDGKMEPIPGDWLWHIDPERPK